MTVPLFYVEQWPPPPEFVLSGDAGLHGAKSLRLGPGDELEIGDSEGSVARATVIAVNRREGLRLRVGATRTYPISRPWLHVVQAVPKGDRGPLAVELMAEVGVNSVSPWFSERTVAVWDTDQDRAKRSRWQRVATAASQQSHRPFRLGIEQPLRDRPAGSESTIVLHESAERPLSEVSAADFGERVTVVIGPEGGLTNDEVGELAYHGAVVVGMGPTIMRTSTAGAAAAVWLRGISGAWNDEGS